MTESISELVSRLRVLEADSHAAHMKALDKITLLHGLLAQMVTTIEDYEHLKGYLPPGLVPLKYQVEKGFAVIRGDTQ